MEYLYFTFNGISSSKFNTFIINNGEDLSFPSQPGFDNKIVSPLFQGASYLAGVDKKDRTFNFRCWSDKTTRDRMNDMIKWLSPDTIGDLILDYNPNFKYNVKLQSISDFTHIATDEENYVSYEFSLSFVTIEDSAAISRLTYVLNNTDAVDPLNEDAIGNYTLNPYPLMIDNLAPIGVYDSSKIKIFNYYDEPIYPNLSIAATTSVAIQKNGIAHYTYTAESPQAFTINGKYGFVKIGTNLAESVSGVTAVNQGPLVVDPGEKTILYSTIDTYSTGTIVLHNEDSIVDYSDLTNLYFVVQDEDYGVELLAQIDSVAEQQELIAQVIKREVPVTSVAGRTGDIVLTKADVGLNNVDNTSDANKPISTAQQTAIDNKVDKLMATNLVTNGDFSNGTTGWTIQNATVVANPSGGVNVTPSAQYGGIFQRNASIIVAGNKYYTAVRLTVGNMEAFLQIGNATYRSIRNKSNEIVSAVIIPPSGEFSIVCSTFDSSGFETMTVHYAKTFNLTQIFGEGKEPSAKMMDNLLTNFPNSWFDGTQDIMPYKDIVNGLKKTVLDLTFNNVWKSGAVYDDVTKTFTLNSHGFVNTQAIEFSNGSGMLPNGVQSFNFDDIGGQYYNIINATTNTFQITSTVGGTTPHTTTDSGVAGFLVRSSEITLSSTSITGLDLNIDEEYTVYIDTWLVKRTTGSANYFLRLNNILTANYLSSGTGVYLSSLFVIANTVISKYSKLTSCIKVKKISDTTVLLSGQSLVHGSDNKSVVTQTYSYPQGVLSTTANITGFIIGTLGSTHSHLKNGLRVIAMKG